MIATQFNGHIKVCRSDNVHELLFHDQFSKVGIIHQFSCVQTPQQNSIVERKHQHLLNVARALCFQSNMLTQFWIGSVIIVSCQSFNMTLHILDSIIVILYIMILESLGALHLMLLSLQEGPNLLQGPSYMYLLAIHLG